MTEMNPSPPPQTHTTHTHTFSGAPAYEEHVDVHLKIDQ